MSQKRVHAGFAASAIAPAPSGLAVFGGQGHHRYRSRFSDRNRRLLGGGLLRLDLKLDPVKTVVHAPATGHLSVDELRKLLTVKRRLAQSVLAPELIEPAPRLHGHGDLHLGSKAPGVPDLGSGRCAYSEVTFYLDTEVAK